MVLVVAEAIANRRTADDRSYNDAAGKRPWIRKDQGKMLPRTACERMTSS